MAFSFFRTVAATAAILGLVVAVHAEEPASKPASPAPAANTPAAQAPAPTTAPSQKFATPALVTDIGQGNGAKLLNVMLGKIPGLDAKLKELAKTEDLEGVKSLVMVVGASTKGLGAAGLNAEQEIARTKELIDEARKRGIPIVGVHLGGNARRGEFSDNFVELVVKNSTRFIVWEPGNEDGFIGKVAKEAGVPLEVVSAKTEIGRKVATLLGVDPNAPAASTTPAK